MIIDSQIVDALAVEFLRKRGEGYYVGNLLPGDDNTNLGSLERRFNSLYVNNLHAQVLTAAGTTTDTVDGFHASDVPHPNMLLALGADAKFPAEALGSVLFTTGGIMTGDLGVAPGVLVDGVDINTHFSDYLNHKALGAAQAHDGLGPHDHLTSQMGGDLLQYANTDGYGSRAAYSAMRLRRYLTPGRGLTGGGLFDHDLRLDVVPGDGLSISSANGIQLNTPGTVGAGTTNAAVGSHTHAVTASSDPAGEILLKSNSQGGLRIKQLAIGLSAIPGAGSVRASGDIWGNRILSDGDTFVGNNLSVGTNILNTDKTRSSVFVNRETANPAVQGALTVRPGSASQRGFIIQGKTGQENTAPLLAAVDANGQDVFVVRPDGMLESGNPGFVSGLRGWRITNEGDAEFRNITARGELHASVFVANEIHATGGTMAVMTTGTVDSPLLATDNIVGSTFNLIVSGDPNVPGASIFSLNDVLRVKLITGLKEN